MKKIGKVTWMIIGGVLAALVAVAIIVGVVMHNNAKKHEEASVAAMSSDIYRKLYAMKGTKLKEKDKITEIRSLTAYYGHNTDVANAEIKKDGKNDGMVISLVKKGNYRLQSNEMEQQAMVLLALVPELDFVEYVIKDETYRKWQQYGEESGGQVFVAEDDKKMKEYTKDGYTFQAFMDKIRPVYDGQSLHEAVGELLQAKTKEIYGDEECAVESHRIVSALGKDGKTHVSVLTTTGAFRFMNGNLIRLDKMNIEPAVMVLVKNAAGNYEVEYADYANIGIEGEEAIRQLFVKQTADNVLGTMETFRQDLANQEKQAAADYAASLSRTCEVGTFAEFPVEYLDKKVANTDVMDKILVDPKLMPYPIFIGNQEYLENGTRYVYETAFREEDATILFKKYDFKTKETKEEFKVSAQTGDYIG